MNKSKGQRVLGIFFFRSFLGRIEDTISKLLSHLWSSVYLNVYLNYEISVTVCLFYKMDAQRQTRWSVNVKFVIDGVVFEEFFDNCTLNSRRRALCVSK